MNSGETGLQTYLHVDSRSTTGVSNIQPGGSSRAKGFSLTDRIVLKNVKLGINKRA